MYIPKFHRQPKLLDDNDSFALKVKEAVKVVETILDNTRNPSLASPKHEHSYNDKYTLSEFITNTAVTSLLNVLDKMGLSHNEGISHGNDGELMTTSKSTETTEALRKLTRLVQNDKKSVIMRFIAKETCTFVCEKEFEIESPCVVEETNVSSPSESIVSHVYSEVVKSKVKEYHWNIDISYDIYLYTGNETSINHANSIPIMTNNISSNLVTRTSTQPFSPSVEIEPMDVSLTWLLKILNKDSLQSDFTIDREKPTCRTPRSNDDIFKAWEFFTNINKWSVSVNEYFHRKEQRIIEMDNYDKFHLRSITGESIFVPVLPLFETSSDTNSNQSPIITNGEVNQFLHKQYVTMTENIESLQKHFKGQIMSSVEAVLILLTKHASSIVEYYFSGINHIEDMLCTQLYNAIGKYVSNDDLDDFVRSYNQKLFAATYTPESFCYAIRRPGHYPDGLISIEEHKSSGNDKGAERNAMTFTRQLDTSNGENEMLIPINSATSVQFTGNMFLHAWMMQRFQQSKPSFKLASRARQFSSFLLLVGKLSGPNTFEPEHGIILQNQDEVLIPLLLEEMPSAKEFKDAIESLSPEQQRFAKEFRNMKLSSSVFGVCVIQLKPQLEKLLGLPEKSLTKEIRLTQSLLSLFIDYQVPSDLLSFDGDDGLDAGAKVEVVKGHVKNVEDMINDLKDSDMKKARMEADMAKALRTQKYSPSFEESMSDNFVVAACAVDDDTVCYRSFSAPKSSKSFRREKSRGFQLFKYGSNIPPPQVVSGNVPSSQVVSADGSRKISSNGDFNMKKSSAVSRRAKPRTACSTSFHHDQTSPTTSNLNSSTSSNSDNVIQSKPKDISDLTMVPKVLDSKFELFGDDEKYGGSLRSTTIKTDELWTQKRKANILSNLETSTLTSNEQKTERQKAFDLLDALSRSGVVPMSHAELHVVIASTHCFDKSVVNTVVQDNVNPIEKIERSHLLVASIIHDVEVKDLLSDASEVDRIGNHSPQLMID